MKKYYFSWILWFPFIIYFGIGVTILEVLEGKKIRDSWHVGIDDWGILMTLFLGGAVGFVIYPLTFLLVTIILEKLSTSLLINSAIYTLIGGIIGWYTFEFLYDLSAIKEYGLQQSTALIIFAGIGLLFALTEQQFKKKIKFV